MTKQEIKEILNKYRIKNYTINNDLSVDVDLFVNLSTQKFKELPINFRKIKGNFICSCCPNLISLEGTPKEIGGIFDCTECINLISLKGAPYKVEGNYFACCYCRKLSSLQYAPLKCEIPNFKEYILNGTNINTTEADKYLLRRILLGDFKYVDEIIDKNKIKPLLVMKDFDLL